MASKTPPWLKFDLEVWCEDHRLAACPLDTQGFFLRLMRWLAHAETYGHLWMEGGEPTPSELSNTIPLAPKTIAKHLTILKENKVLRYENGRWYSKRMVEDWLEYQEFVKHGKKGGRPKSKGEGITPPSNPDDNHNERTDVRTYEEDVEVDDNDVSLVFQKWQEYHPTPKPWEFVSLRNTLAWLILEFDKQDFHLPASTCLCDSIDELKKITPPPDRPMDYLKGIIRTEMRNNGLVQD